MKAPKHFEKSLSVYQSTRCNILEALDLQQHVHEKLMSRKYVSTNQPVDRRLFSAATQICADLDNRMRYMTCGCMRDYCGLGQGLVVGC
jgi:hypothetical protein